MLRLVYGLLTCFKNSGSLDEKNPKYTFSKILLKIKKTAIFGGKIKNFHQSAEFQKNAKYHFDRAF
tara:strand:+ start:331 stop:528 length:198 start_codon:yes stop_codon:yes gene_type:complete